MVIRTADASSGHAVQILKMGATIRPDGSQGQMTVSYMDPQAGEVTELAGRFFAGVNQVTLPLGLRQALIDDPVPPQGELRRPSGRRCILTLEAAASSSPTRRRDPDGPAAGTIGFTNPFATSGRRQGHAVRAIRRQPGCRPDTYPSYRGADDGEWGWPWAVRLSVGEWSRRASVSARRRA